jgi:hypothetical protein
MSYIDSHSSKVCSIWRENVICYQNNICGSMCTLNVNCALDNSVLIECIISNDDTVRGVKNWN